MDELIGLFLCLYILTEFFKKNSNGDKEEDDNDDGPDGELRWEDRNGIV